METHTPSSEELVKTIFAAALDKKASDVVSLYMEPLIGITDYFVIATGANDRQLTAIVDEIERRVRTEHHLHPAAREGERGSSWIVLDYIDVVVHIFLQDARDEYRLEKLWSEAAQIRAGEGTGAAAATAAATEAVGGIDADAADVTTVDGPPGEDAGSAHA